MKTLSRQATIEAANRKRKLRRTLDLSKQTGFEWTPGHYLYNHEGIEVQLRFSQETYEWTAQAPHLGILTSFPHQPPQDIQQHINDWLAGHIERPSSIEARQRMDRPSVGKLAARHGISPALALEIYDERGF